MIFGYNTDVKSGKTVYHVQTEDRGEKNPVIDSVIYVKGRIVDRKRTPYVTAEHTTEQLQEMVKQQHRGLVDLIRSGNYVIPDEQEKAQPAPAAPAAAAAPVEAPTCPELELTNAADIDQQGGLVFKVRVKDRHTGKPMAGAEVEAVLEEAGGQVRRKATASNEGVAEIRFDPPQKEGESVLFHTTAGASSEVLKFRIARAS